MGLLAKMGFLVFPFWSLFFSRAQSSGASSLHKPKKDKVQNISGILIICTWLFLETDLETHPQIVHALSVDTFMLETLVKFSSEDCSLNIPSSVDSSIDSFSILEFQLIIRQLLNV